MKNKAAFYVVLAVLAGLSAWMLLPFLAPLLVAAVVGYLLTPFYTVLGRWIRSDHLRAALLLLLVLFVVALPLLLALVEVSQQAPAALRKDNLADSIAQFNAALDHTLGRHIPLTENIAVYTEHVREAMLHAAPAIIGHVGETALDLVIFLYTLFFVFLEGRSAFQWFMDLVPLDDTLKPLLAQTIQATMTGVLYGQVITAAMQAGLGGIGYAVVGLPHLLLWTLLTLIAAMLPVGGAAVVWIPLAGSRFLAGDNIGGWGLIIYMGVTSALIEHILKPKLISGRSPLHPLAALFGVLGGLYLFGLTGFLLGPVLLGLLTAMLRFYQEMAAAALVTTMPKGTPGASP
jgi:predicted PurR-regulated permease PerM